MAAWMERKGVEKKGTSRGNASVDLSVFSKVGQMV
jgi:hypothetical protein